MGPRSICDDLLSNRYQTEQSSLETHHKNPLFKGKVDEFRFFQKPGSEPQVWLHSLLRVPPAQHLPHGEIVTLPACTLVVHAL